ncbi:MAG: TIGR01440 family protein [Defluviitaleaceae bacterium]|nr:TIGR01440 family protein [Defluviitaleaceae bacterium]
MINNEFLVGLGRDVQAIFAELIETASLSTGQIVVLGASTSEIVGQHIGRATNMEVGRAVIDAALAVTSPAGIFLAVAACEHINRAIVVEAACAAAYGLDVVNVRPVPEAGGAAAAAAYDAMTAPVMVEHIAAHAGVDIGDTAIGMHVRFVQVPFRPAIKHVGDARVTALTSRPKYIGGGRARYI